MVGSAAGASIQTRQAASANRQQPSTSTGPQVRSRVTVVCAECKRLKLKCDRHNPCGSCVKRDTISKCQYTPAATEKVDTHSLNNRLTRVEGFLVLHTRGRFQSTYPSSCPTGDSTNVTTPCASSSENSHQHHHIAPFHQNDVGDSFLVTPQSLTSVWLKDLEFSISKSSFFGNTPVKVEESSRHSGVHTSFSSSCSGTTQVIPESQLKRRLRSQRNAALMALPPMTIYFLSVPSSAFTQQASTSNCGLPLRSEPLSQNSKPQTTLALFSFLPPLPTCRRLLQFAGEVFRIRPLWFDPLYGSGHGWKGFEIRCLQALGGGEEGTGKRKERTFSAKRAKEIYFGGQQHTSADAEAGSCRIDIEGPLPSLTFFALICVVLAIGAISSEIAAVEKDLPTTESPSFFYALSQQALGVWDTHNSSSATTAGNIEEESDYLFASLLGVVYFLLSGAIMAAADSSQNNVEEDGDDEDSRLVSTLVSKMVNAARVMQLDRERPWRKENSAGNRRFTNSGEMSEVAGSFSLGQSQKSRDIEKERREEWKRTIWWEVMFYDLFIADVLGWQPQLSSTSHKVSLPACGSILRSKALENDDTVLEHEVKSLGTQNVLPPPSSSPSTDGSVDDDAYLGARFRLVQVAQSIKRRNSLLDCCSYTLDQAAALESEIRCWLQELPPALQISWDDEPTPSPAMANETKTKRLQALELAIIRNLLILNVYIPFLGRASDKCNSASQNVPAVSSCTVAAQDIIHLSKELQSFLTSTVPASPVVLTLPMMFDFYPLDKLVFTAVVVCAHAAFARKNSSFSFNAATMAKDVAVGLDVLSFLNTGVMRRSSLHSEMKKVTDMLHSWLSQLKSATKRKHDCIDSPSFRDPSSSNNNRLASEVDTGSGSNHFVMMNKYHHTGLNTQQKSSVTISTMPSTLSAHDSVHPSLQPILTSATAEMGQKDKKGTKKRGYPARSVRIREGKLSKLQGGIPAPSGAVGPKSQSQSTADDVLDLAWKLQQKVEQPPSYPGKTQKIFSGELEVGVDRRSRSSSINYVQSGETSNFGPPQSHLRDEHEIPPKKRQNLRDIRECIPHRICQEQQMSSQKPHFVQHVFDEGHRQTIQPNSFDGPLSSCPPADGMTYGAAARSPFSNANSFGAVASPKLFSSPNFGPHPPVPLPPGDQSIPYFPPQRSPYRPPIFTGSTDSSCLVTQHPHPPLTNVSEMEPGMTSAPSTPVYDNSSYQGVVENYAEHHQTLRQHQMQNHSTDMGPFCVPDMSTQGQAFSIPVSPWPAAQSQAYWESVSKFNSINEFMGR